MDAKKIIQKLELNPSREELREVKKKADEFMSNFRKELLRQGVKAEVFAGGSYAKGTLYKNESYEVDIFVRFDWKYDELSDRVDSVLKKMKLKSQRVHGSRDYFKINEGIVNFEVVPVCSIKNPKEARNVTDLSYFHVNYVRKKAKSEKMKNEIRIAKAFCKANRVYGAESYVRGFSGYALECLIINYGSFLKMLGALTKAEGKILIDPEKKYKKSEIMINMNESRTHSPIVLVDPTWKERNVLAALGDETFEIFRKAAKAFLARPDESYFVKKEIDVNRIREMAVKKKAEFVEVEIETDRQEGDIAGTKMKKFSEYLKEEIRKDYQILYDTYSYNLGQSSKLYLVLKSKGEIIRIGPPIGMKEHCKEFKKRNKRVFIKNGLLHAITDVKFSGKDFVERFKVLNDKKLEQMSISGLIAKG
ncbi:MAG: nucleotidyltransferase domain-containing protein [archaeon]